MKNKHNLFIGNSLFNVLVNNIGKSYTFSLFGVSCNLYYKSDTLYIESNSDIKKLITNRTCILMDNAKYKNNEIKISSTNLGDIEYNMLCNYIINIDVVIK